jgi:hypothetical protein
MLSQNTHSVLRALLEFGHREFKRQYTSFHRLIALHALLVSSKGRASLPETDKTLVVVAIVVAHPCHWA